MSTLGQQDSDLGSFFGNSQQFAAFIQANNKDADYSRSVLNGPEDLATAENKEIFQMMLAKNYMDFRQLKDEGVKEGFAVKENDVHPDFTAFIINAALNLRQIDPREGNGQRVSPFVPTSTSASTRRGYDLPQGPLKDPLKDLRPETMTQVRQE